MPEPSPIKAHQHGCLIKNNNRRHGQVDTGKPMEPQPYTKNHGNQGMPRAGESAFPGEGHRNGFSNAT